jgi:hypothetical protein
MVEDLLEGAHVAGSMSALRPDCRVLMAVDGTVPRPSDDIDNAISVLHQTPGRQREDLER